MVSIIVPAYNAENTIVTCLDSLIHQTLTDFEVVIVDDGSTDGTGRILDTWKQKYPHILKVIHQENAGVWRARKTGITNAKGDYIGFCDSDDFVNPSIYEKMYYRILRDDAQIAVCSYQRYRGSKQLGNPEMCSFGDKVLEVTEENLGDITIINTALWNKLFRAEILRNAIDFEKPPRIAEDMMFFLSIIPFAQKITFISEPLYHYNVYDTSAMGTVSGKDAEQTMQSMIEVKKSMPVKYHQLVDAMAFIHLGISIPINLANNNINDMGKNFKKIRQTLELQFPTWKKNPYIRMGYIKHHNVGLKKTWFAQKIYKLHLFRLFIHIYHFAEYKLHIHIKW